MVKIISDSASVYSVAEGKKINLDIAPLQVTINNKTYIDLEDITTEAFVELINEGHVPISSQPSIGKVVELYEQYPDEEIINITIADGLSGTYNSACTAKDMIENSHNVTVFNSQTLNGPQRYMVECAVKLADANKSKNEIIETLTYLRDNSLSFLMPNDFDFLVRGGRLSPLAGRIGSAIKLVPIMTLTQDGTRLDRFSAKRTMTKAVQKVCDALVEAKVDETYKIYVSHSASESVGLAALEAVKARIPNADTEFILLSPAFTTQGGPGCIAIQAIKKIEC